MGDVDRGEAEPVLERLDLVAQLHAHLGVEVRQRLVEKEKLRLDGERAPERDALALAAGEVRDLALLEAREVEQLQHLADPPPHLGPRHAAQAQAVADVAEHRHVRPERVGLEHHRDVALLRGEVRDIAAGEPDGAGRGLLEAGDGAQERGLAAAGRAEDRDELARRDGEVDAMQHRRRAVADVEVLDLDGRGVGHPGSPCRNACFEARSARTSA